MFYDPGCEEYTGESDASTTGERTGRGSTYSYSGGGYYRSGDYSRRSTGIMGKRKIHIHLAPQRPSLIHRKTGEERLMFNSLCNAPNE